MATGKISVVTLGIQGPAGPSGPQGPSGGAGTDHSSLSNLDFAHAGHIGFAGLGVSNHFTADQLVDGLVTVNNQVFIQPSTDKVPLVVQGATGQTAPLLELKDPNGFVVVQVDVDGSSVFQDVTATIFTASGGGSLSGGGLGLAPGSTISVGNGSVFHVSAFGDVNAAGTVTATSFSGDGSALTGVVTSVPSSRLLYVSTGGSDSSGTRGRIDKPYLTPLAAQTAASSGDTIVVYPGTYTITAVLGKNGVNWYLMPGVIITRADGGSVFTDGGSAMVYTVGGYGTISNSGDITVGATVAVVKMSNAASVIHLTCDTIDALAVDADGSGASDAVYQSAGNLHVTADKIHLGAGSISNGWGLYWLNGEMDVTVRNLVIDQGYAIGATVTATPTGDMRVRASEITGNGFQMVEHTSTQAEAKLWVEAFLISGTSFGTIHATGGKTYITAQKISGCTGTLDATGGVVQCTGGQLWLNAEKVTGTYGTGVLVSGGTAFVNVQQFEDLGHLTQCASVTGGTLNLGPVRATPSLGHGLVVSGGTLNAVSPTITTTGGSTKDLKQTGGTLNVSGGWGTSANGSFVTTGTVTYLPQRVDAGASPTFVAVTTSSLNTPEVTSVPTLTLDSSSGVVWLQSASAQGLTVDSQGGTQILGAVSFFGQTLAGQYSTTGTTTGFTAGVGTTAKSDSTYTGNSGTKAYTVGDIVKALKALGLLASS